MRRAIHILMAPMLIVLPINGTANAKEAKVKYAKSEVDKAAGKCVGSILGGALLGALVGRVVGGKKGTGAGAAVGAAAGTAICAILMTNAKRKDRILAAQIASANHTSRPYVTQFGDDNGQITTFAGTASASRNIDSAKLIPVRYKTEDGTEVASPVFDTGGQECRSVSSSLSSGGNIGKLPEQMICRTADGNWQPYGVKTI